MKRLIGAAFGVAIFSLSVPGAFAGDCHDMNQTILGRGRAESGLEQQLKNVKEQLKGFLASAEKEREALIGQRNEKLKVARTDRASSSSEGAEEPLARVTEQLRRATGETRDAMELNRKIRANENQIRELESVIAQIEASIAKLEAMETLSEEKNKE